MRLRNYFWKIGLGLALGSASQASAQTEIQTTSAAHRPAPIPSSPGPGCLPGPTMVSPSPLMPSPLDPKSPMPVDPKAPAPQPAPLDQQAAPQAFAEAPSAGTGATGSFNPAMFGDLLGTSRLRRTINGHTVLVPRTNTGSFKIADNESPRPMDRFTLLYNYFSHAATDGGPEYAIHREVMGLEKTFLDGNGSVAVRVPLIQSTQTSTNDELISNQLGDITVAMKYAFLNDCQTGNVLSGGLVVSIPVGPTVPTDDGRTIRPFLIQPFVGWIYNANSTFFAQGFHSVIVPTSSSDVSALSNDVAVGAWMMRNNDGNSFLRGIAPTLELHLYTPLNHGSSGSALLTAPDILTVTSGINFVMDRNSTLGIAVGVPVTGPRPNELEGIVSFSYRF